ncbi:hypothetical protein ACFX12_040021 [Malus domestica]
MTFTNSVLLLVSTRKLIKASLAYLINSVTLKAPMTDQEMAVPFEISRELQAKNKQVEGTLLPLTNCQEWQVQRSRDINQAQEVVGGGDYGSTHSADFIHLVGLSSWMVAQLIRWRRCDYGTKVYGLRGRGRPRKTLEETLRKDFEYLNLTDDMTQNRAQWRSMIHIADPT